MYIVHVFLTVLIKMHILQSRIFGFHIKLLILNNNTKRLIYEMSDNS